MKKIILGLSALALISLNSMAFAVQGIHDHIRIINVVDTSTTPSDQQPGQAASDSDAGSQAQTQPQNQPADSAQAPTTNDQSAGNSDKPANDSDY